MQIHYLKNDGAYAEVRIHNCKAQTITFSKIDSLKRSFISDCTVFVYSIFRRCLCPAETMFLLRSVKHYNSTQRATCACTHTISFGCYGSTTTTSPSRMPTGGSSWTSPVSSIKRPISVKTACGFWETWGLSANANNRCDLRRKRHYRINAYCNRLCRRWGQSWKTWAGLYCRSFAVRAPVVCETDGPVVHYGRWRGDRGRVVRGCECCWQGEVFR